MSNPTDLVLDLSLWLVGMWAGYLIGLYRGRKLGRQAAKADYALYQAALGQCTPGGTLEVPHGPKDSVRC